MTQTLSRFEETLADYFRGRLENACARLTPPPQEDTLCYVGNMLARLGDSKKLFGYGEEYGLRPLALLYKDAHETGNMHQRCLVMRQMGDMALFIGALFSEHYARRGIFKDYFIGMGGSAYAYLSNNAHQNRHIYSELAETFARMLKVVAYACSREYLYSPSDLLGIYERWRATRSPELRAQLLEFGISVADETRPH